MRPHWPDFSDADWHDCLDWIGLVEQDLLILGDLKCRLKSLWLKSLRLKLDVMRDKGLLKRRMRRMNRMKIWLLLLLLHFLEHDDVRLPHILEKESICLIQKVDQKQVVYARYHAGKVETKLNPAVAGCVLLFQNSLYSLLQLLRIIISLSETSSRRERGGLLLLLLRRRRRRRRRYGHIRRTAHRTRCETSHGADACNDFHNIGCAIITVFPRRGPRSRSSGQLYS